VSPVFGRHGYTTLTPCTRPLIGARAPVMLGKRRAHVLVGSSLLLLFLISLASHTLPVYASASPDLTVESVWLERSSQPGQPVSEISPGEQFDIVVTVKNIGDTTAYGFYLDAYYDSDYGRGGPDDIAPGETQTWYVGPLNAESGTHTTTWVIDPDNQIPELNENNNQKEHSFTVGSAVEYTVSVYTRREDGSLMAGVQVTLGTETKTSDPGGKTDFVISAGTYSLAVQSPVSGGSGIQYVFSQWADGDTQNPRTITLDASVTYDATYRTQYQLIMQAAPSDGGTTDPPVGTYWYEPWQTVDIQAFPASGYAFSSWTGSGSGSYSGSESTALVTMNSPVTETANFLRPTITLSPTSGAPGTNVIVSGSGFARGDTGCAITSSPDGLAVNAICALSSGVVSGSFSVATAPSGTYSVIVTGTIGGTASASFEVRSTLPVTITAVSMLPDASQVIQGSAMSFSVTLRNTGTTTVSKANVQVKIYGPDGLLVASPSASVSRLRPGREATVKISYTLPLSAPVGDWKYDVYAYATSPLDQLTGQSFTVQPAVITGKILSVTDSPDPVRSGRKATFTVKIMNTGNIAWPAAQISIKIYKPDGTLATTISLKASNVQPGIENTYKAQWTAARLKGTYTYEVYLDYATYRVDSSAGNTIQVT